MSMDLYVWKRPMVSEDAAPQLLERFYEEGDTSAFEPSEDVSRFYDELVAMYTDFEGERSDRIIDLSLSWIVPDDILNGIVALAQKHDLVLYDPQGPSFHSPVELLVEPIRRDPAVLRQTLIGLLIGVVLVVGGWFVPLPVLNWIALVIGVLMVAMALYSIVVWLRE